MGKEHSAYGRANHPFMTGSGGWAYFAATRYILGIRPQMDELVIDPCIPRAWKGFLAVRKWRGATYRITVENPHGVSRGVCRLYVDGCRAGRVPVFEPGTEHTVRAVMGSPEESGQEN